MPKQDQQLFNKYYCEHFACKVPPLYYNYSQGRSPEETLLFFWILSKLPAPPNLNNLYFELELFSDVEIQDLKLSLVLEILYLLYNILYMYNLV